MALVRNILERLREGWSAPRMVVHPGQTVGSPLVCVIEAHHSVPEPKASEAPIEVIELWANSSVARLFVDPVYGQWGLVLHSPVGSTELTNSFVRNRPRHFTLRRAIFVVVHPGGDAAERSEVIADGAWIHRLRFGRSVCEGDHDSCASL